MGVSGFSQSTLFCEIQRQSEPEDQGFDFQLDNCLIIQRFDKVLIDHCFIIQCFDKVSRLWWKKSNLKRNRNNSVAPPISYLSFSGLNLYVDAL